jgi:hypothetical protein
MICLPSELDLKHLILALEENCFWTLEEYIHSDSELEVKNKEFNFEYALLTHKIINLNKKDLARLALIKDCDYQMRIIKD